MKAPIIRHRTVGIPHGPITRMVSPEDLGESIKPFVFLDFLNAEIPANFGFGFHPHSGIATLTYQLDCDVEYEDTAGQKGIVRRGGLEWMQAGGGVWHRGTLTGSSHVTGFQLWVALPVGLEDGPSEGRYVAPQDVPTVGGVKVLLGEYGGMTSPIPPPAPMLYLHVKLAKGQRWSIDLPLDFDLTWIMVFDGEVDLGGEAMANEFLVLEVPDRTLTITSGSGAQFMLGAARRHPYPLVLGNYSVHTNAVSLKRGEDRIRELGAELTRTGRR